MVLDYIRNVVERLYSNAVIGSYAGVVLPNVLYSFGDDEGPGFPVGGSRFGNDDYRLPHSSSTDPENDVTQGLPEDTSSGAQDSIDDAVDGK